MYDCMLNRKDIKNFLAHLHLEKWFVNNSSSQCSIDFRIISEHFGHILIVVVPQEGELAVGNTVVGVD